MGEMTKKPTVPAIRFKGFTDTWEQRKLGDIVTVYDGVHQTPNYQTSGVMFLSVENIATLKSNKFISFEDFKRDYKVYPQRNDILMTRIGDVGTTNVVTDNDVKAYYVSLALLKYKETNPFFLSSAIQSDFVQKGLSNRTLKTAIPMKINKDEIGQVDVMLPTSADEQDKIGSFFSQLDTLITLHQRKLDKLHKVKRSLLERMFPRNGANVPEIRFSGFTDAWEQRKLGSIADKVTEKNGQLSYSETFTNSAEFGIISQRDFFDHDISNSENIGGYYVVRDNDFVYNPRISVTAPCGPINCNRLGRNGVMSPLYTVFKAHDIDTLYLEWFFKSSYWHSFMYYNGDSGARSDRFSIKNDLFFMMPIPVPTEEEQRRIGSLLSTLDKAITLHQRKLETLQKMKKSLLQKMFV